MSVLYVFGRYNYSSLTSGFVLHLLEYERGDSPEHPDSAVFLAGGHEVGGGQRGADLEVALKEGFALEGHS